jgi:N-acetylmuramoyl-L-alanine amidase
LLLAFSSFAQRTDLSGLKICIDPGHGGHNEANDRLVTPDEGTVFWESESNLKKAFTLKPMLEARGATVLLTRTINDYPNDDPPSLSARVEFANSNNVDWFNSIHSDATKASDITATTNTWINSNLVLVREKRSATNPAASTGYGMGIPERQESLDMAGIMSRRIHENNRTTRYSVWLDWSYYGGANGGWSLGVLRGLLMPGELTEGSFHDYYPETRRLMNSSYRKMDMYALYDSFLEYFGVDLDSLGRIAGTREDGDGNLIDNLVIRLLPLDRIYVGDAYHNGYFLFDALPPDEYTLRFETPGYPVDSVSVTIPRTVIRTEPRQGAAGVKPDAEIRLTFVSEMDTAFVREAFSVTPPLAGEISWNNQNTVMIFVPGRAMDSNTTYSLTLDKMGYLPAPTVFVDNNTITPPKIDTPFKGTGGAFVLSFRTVASPVPVVQHSVDAAPERFAITQLSSGSFDKSITVSFDIPERLLVSFSIYNTQGRRVSELLNREINPGSHAFKWNVSHLPRGYYFCTLQAGADAVKAKLALLGE